MGKRWVLVDGHSLAYRAFYALPPDLATSSGQMTNAVYGFVSMLIKVMEELRPQALVVAFDKGKPEFRTERYAEYKAHRKPMPDGLREQLDLIRAVLEALEIPSLEQEGYEADDVLATLTAQLPREDEVFIVTGDRDALQLVGERVKVIANRKGLSDIVVYDAEAVKERYGVEPGQIVDYLALKGDASDNIPGIPGIGEKTAAALVATYGDLEGVLENLDKIKAARVRKALLDNWENALLSRELAAMRRDVPLHIEDLGAWEMRPWDDDKLGRVFESLEFRKLYERLRGLRQEMFPRPGSAGQREQGLERGIRVEVDGEEALEEALRACATQGEVSLYGRIEGEGYTRGRMSSAAAASGGRSYRFALDHEGGRRLFRRFLEGLVSLAGLKISCYRGKDFVVQCRRMFGLCPSLDFDVDLANYLVNPSEAGRGLHGVAQRYLRLDLGARPAGQMGMLEEGEADAGEDAERASAVARLVAPLEAELNLKGLRDLYDKVEMPLQGVLAEMEVRGIRLDPAVLAEMERELQEELRGLEEEAYRLAGEEFNLNSPQQLSRILFEVLELPPVKKTKTGLATDISVLNALRDLHPIAPVLVSYRELSKLLNTYVSALPKLIDPETHRLHACFNQTVTATGRLSSSNPNLQNIPVRTERGKRIRKAFLPTSPRGLILSADYSQIELRVMAHLSGDPGLKRAFEEGRDIHASTASKVFDIPFDQIGEEHRRAAKTINFGIIYGISAYGLADRLGIEQEVAERYIEEYFREFPKVREFLDRQVQEAAKTGYVTTVLGRRREIPELAEGNLRLRRLGERLAFNTPIQGSAADIIKIAMVRVHRRLEREGLRSRIILQVHDELVCDVEEDEADRVRDIVRSEMEGAYELDVPLRVDLGMGPSWYDAK